MMVNSVINLKSSIKISILLVQVRPKQSWSLGLILSEIAFCGVLRVEHSKDWLLSFNESSILYFAFSAPSPSGKFELPLAFLIVPSIFAPQKADIVTFFCGLSGYDDSYFPLRCLPRFCLHDTDFADPGASSPNRPHTALRLLVSRASFAHHRRRR
jgi:hypothetical protein